MNGKNVSKGATRFIHNTIRETGHLAQFEVKDTNDIVTG